MQRLLVAPVALVLLCPVQATASPFEEQVEQYIREYPRRQTYDQAVRFTGGDPAKLNTWLIPGEPALIKAGADVVPHTNNDTYYQVAVVWLGDGPAVLASSAPSHARFSSFQLQDDRNANYRNIVFPEGEYTLYFGDRPAEIRGEPVEVPSRLSLVFVRVEVKNERDPDDVAAAKSVLAGMTIAGSPPREFPRLDLSSRYPAPVVEEADRRLDEAFARVPFSRTVVGPGQAPGTDVPYLYHAAGTKGGLGGPDPAHSTYEAIFFDGNGEPLTGRRGAYTVTAEEPPVDAFWSVTVYDTERGSLLHPNAEDRYHINGTTAVRNDDGTVTFTFERTCASTDTNCLEVPAGRFEVVARYYLPSPEIIHGDWTFPKIELID